MDNAVAAGKLANLPVMVDFGRITETRNIDELFSHHLRPGDIYTHCFSSHREETLQMLLTCGFDWVHVYLAMPIFGSRLYDICVDKGYIDNPKSQDFVATKSVIRAPGVDPVKLETFAYEMQLRVNFVENHNMKIGRYDVPIDYLKNVVNK